MDYLTNQVPLETCVPAAPTPFVNWSYSYPSFAELIRRTDGKLVIACDTEFTQDTTLCVQFAVRADDHLIIQTYHHPDVRPPVFSHEQSRFPSLGEKRLLLRPSKIMSNSLSPVRIVCDLFGIRACIPLSLDQRPEFSACADGPALEITLVAHYWPADFLRVFGNGFFSQLFGSQSFRSGRLSLTSGKLLGFRSRTPRDNRPVVLEYACEVKGGVVHPVRLRTVDTNLPFGSQRLEDLSQAFLGVGKVSALSPEDKTDMARTFQSKPSVAWQYAIQDVVLTLQLYERMLQLHTQMYHDLLSCPEDMIPPMKPTLGRRVADMLLRAIALQVGSSDSLSTRGQVSLTKVQKLMQKGSATYLSLQRHSRFGEQTGQVHGGLLYSRSPDHFFHSAPGHFRDIDLAGCYPSVIRNMHLYVGRPVILEPGDAAMTLAKAVRFAKEHAAGSDAWFVKVSGQIKSCPNTLIPSTKDALTTANIRSRTQKRKFRDRYVKKEPRRQKEDGCTVILTEDIEAGIVCHATWLIIQALPKNVRQEYEQLRVDSLVFYPAKFSADNPAAFDSLVRQYTCEGASFTETLELDLGRKVIHEKLDEEYVHFRFSIGELAAKMIALREKASQENGKRSAASFSWKQQANTLYGVLASKFLPTNNVVAANVITATSRALAFCMQMSLNGVQVITDGCTFRDDQVPAGTLTECLQTQADYPIHLARNGITFLDSKTIPLDDAQFTNWYRRHVMRFFDVSGTDYEQLFSLHQLGHKTDQENRVTFDGLCCDGAGNHIKLIKEAENWKVLEVKARGYNQEGRAKLATWMLRTYTEDQYQVPDGIETGRLIGLPRAGQIANKGLQLYPQVYLPLGLEERRIQVYRIIRETSFLFRSARRQASFLRALSKFKEKYGVGLELLTLREGRHERRQGSLSDLAKHLFQLIQSGTVNFSRALNLTRDIPSAEISSHLVVARTILLRNLLERIAISPGIPGKEPLTGLIVDLPMVSLLSRSAD